MGKSAPDVGVICDQKNKIHLLWVISGLSGIFFSCAGN